MKINPLQQIVEGMIALAMERHPPALFSRQALFEQFKVFGDHGITVLGRDLDALMDDFTASIDPAEFLE